MKWLSKEKWTDEYDTRDPCLIATGAYDDMQAAADAMLWNTSEHTQRLAIG